MRVSHLKSYFINLAYKPLIIMVLMIILLILVYWVERIYEDKYNVYKQKQQELKYKLDMIDENIKQSKNIKNTWDKIKNDNFSEVGVRIEKAKKIIDDLQKECYIHKLKATFSNPVIRNDHNNHVVGLEYTDLDISFDTYLDIDAFKFMKGLEAKIPGIINYTYLTMALQDRSIDQTILNEIKSGNSTNLVHVGLSIVWQDFIKLKNDNEND